MDYHCRTDEEGLRLWEEARAQAAQPSIPTIDISNLPPEAKRLVWAHIQATDPLLAALLQTAHIGEMRKMFDAHVLIPQDVVDEALYGRQP